MSKPILISGIQPTGRLHLGNYLGALKNFVELQNSGKYECYFFIADYHSLTIDFDPAKKAEEVLGVAKAYLAAGIDPKKSSIFVQSHIPESTELAWILSPMTNLSEMDRMTQFKERAGLKQFTHTAKKLHENEEDLERFHKLFHSFTEGSHSTEEHRNMERMVDKRLFHFLNDSLLSLSNYEKVRAESNMGLYSYPILMAADILLYDTKNVPVGNDQLQHLEFTRTLVRKFNNKFGQIFIEPQALLTKTPRVMSLNDPMKKMSKSQPEGCLFLDDSPKEIENKIKRAVTDSGSEIKFDLENKAGISNLLLIYEALTGETIADLEKKYAGKGYGQFKSDLAEVVTESVKPFRELKANSSKLKAALTAGDRKAKKMASAKMKEVKKKLGLL